MPIKRMLKGRNFSPQSAAILVKAFNDVVDELDLRLLSIGIEPQTASG